MPAGMRTRPSMTMAGGAKADMAVSPSGLLSREQVRDGHTRDDLSGELHRHGVARLEVCPPAVGRMRARPGRVGEHLDLIIDEVDDPVNRDTGRGVDTALLDAVEIESRVGHLDHEGDLAGTGVVVLVLPC